MFRESKKMKKFLEKTYRKESQDTFIIEIDIDKYIEVFSEWDKSTFRSRDLHPELEDFLSRCSDDIPLKYNLALYFYLPSAIKDVEAEKIIIDSIRNYYNHFSFEYQKRKNEEKRDGIKYLTISIFFIVIGYLGRINFFETLLFETLNEALLIGGWVFMWEFFSKIVFNHETLKRRYKKSLRLVNASIVFKYEKKVDRVSKKV